MCLEKAGHRTFHIGHLQRACHILCIGQALVRNVWDWWARKAVLVSILVKLAVYTGRISDRHGHLERHVADRSRPERHVVSRNSFSAYGPVSNGVCANTS